MRRGINLSEETPSSSTSPASENAEDENEQEVEWETDEDDHGDEQEAAEAGDDSFTPDPIDDRSLQDNLNAIKMQLQELSRTMNACQLAQDPETRIHQIYQETKSLSEFKDQETRIVGFIGETGVGWCSLLFTLTPKDRTNRQVGKSSVINSILDQRGLARSVYIPSYVL